MKSIIFYLILFIGISTLNANTFSDENEEEMNQTHQFHHNHFALFTGGTTFTNDGANYFSLGLDYVYLLNADSPWAFSLFGEVVFGEESEWVIGIPVYYFLSKSTNNSLWLRAGPGLEFFSEESQSDLEESLSYKAEFLFRVGIGYGFNFGKYSISPTIDFDFVRKNNAIVWGINFGYGF